MRSTTTSRRSGRSTPTLPDHCPGERTRPDGALVRWQLAAAPTLGPERPPFLIEHAVNSAEWSAADRVARASGAARLTTLELTVDAVDGTSRAMLRTVGLRFRPSLAGGGARDADIGPQRLRLRPRRDPVAVVATVHLAVEGGHAADLDLLGCHWIVRPKPG
jgi:hypothetical protein